MHIRINSETLSNLNKAFRISAEESTAAAARFRAGIDPIQHSHGMVAEKARFAPAPRDATGRLDSDASGQPFPDGPSRGPTKPFPGERDSSPFLEAGDQVARAKNHIEAFEDESDEMPKHERLSRAADLLRSAAETMRPRGEGSQHLARR
jgi:hypothetical protein